MTNYNERLDALMPCDCKFLKGFAWRKGDPCEGCINGSLKQALTSLIKELVAEAKPLYYASPDKSEYQDGFNTCIRLYEQNLLKALEEV